jgi:hypothetical protein
VAVDGILELHSARLLHTRSGGCRSSDLRFVRPSADRSCPLLSAVRRSAADPPRTSAHARRRTLGSSPGRGRPWARRSSATSSGAGRSVSRRLASAPLLPAYSGQSRAVPMSRSTACTHPLRSTEQRTLARLAVTVAVSMRERASAGRDSGSGLGEVPCTAGSTSRGSHGDNAKWVRGTPTRSRLQSAGLDVAWPGQEASRTIEVGCAGRGAHDAWPENPFGQDHRAG